MYVFRFAFGYSFWTWLYILPLLLMCSYSIVVERADESFRGPGLRPLTWRSLAALSRTTANVSKVSTYLYLAHFSKQSLISRSSLYIVALAFHVQELMFSYVVVPSGMTQDDFSSPECLKRLKVQVRHLYRFGFNYKCILLAVFDHVWAFYFRR